MLGLIGHLSSGGRAVPYAESAASFAAAWHVVQGEGVSCGQAALVGLKTNVSRQPVYRDEDGSLAIVDGVFSNRSVFGLPPDLGDGAFLLAAFRAGGEEAFARLEGSYNLFLFDARSGVAYLVSDRFASRQLFFFADGENLFFAPRLRAFKTWEGFSRRPCWPAIARFLSLGYVAGDLSLLDGVRFLSPASLVRWSPGEVVQRRYWRLAPGSAEDQPRDNTARAWADRLDRALQSQIARVGELPGRKALLLSGGFDSRLIAAYLHRAEIDFEAVSLCFNGQESRDTDAALQISRVLGVRHSFLNWDVEAGSGRLREFLDLTDGCGACSYLSNGYDIAGLAERVDLVLQGNNGNHLFGDYATRYWLRMATLMSDKVPLATLHSLESADTLQLLLIHGMLTDNQTYRDRRALFSDEFATLMEQESLTALRNTVDDRPDLSGGDLFEYVALMNGGVRGTNTTPWMLGDWVEHLNPLFLSHSLAETTTAMPTAWKYSRLADVENQLRQFPQLLDVPKVGGYPTLLAYPATPSAGGGYYDVATVLGRVVKDDLRDRMFDPRFAMRPWLRPGVAPMLYSRAVRGDISFDTLGLLISLEHFFTSIVED